MKQLILLNDRIPSKEKDVSVFALPRFTRCSVISDVFDDVPDAISRYTLHAYKCRISFIY